MVILLWKNCSEVLGSILPCIALYLRRAVLLYESHRAMLSLLDLHLIVCVAIGSMKFSNQLKRDKSVFWTSQNQYKCKPMPGLFSAFKKYWQPTKHQLLCSSLLLNLEELGNFSLNLKETVCYYCQYIDTPVNFFCWLVSSKLYSQLLVISTIAESGQQKVLSVYTTTMKTACLSSNCVMQHVKKALWLAQRGS